MTTFKRPLRVYAESKDTNSDAGDVVITQTASIVFGDTSITVGRLPPNTRIIEIYVDVMTFFNAGANNNIDLGVVGELNRFGDNLPLTDVARVLVSSDVSQLINYGDTGDTGITLLATYNGTGAAPTQGMAEVTVVYVARADLRT